MSIFVLSVLLSLIITFLGKNLSEGENVNRFYVYLLTQGILGYLSLRGETQAGLVFFSILLLIAIVDYYTKTIVSASLGVLFLLALFQMLLSAKGLMMTHIYGGLLGLILYGSIYGLAKCIYKREAFGSGDVWLMSGIGLYVGFSKSLWISFLSFYVALAIIGILFIKRRKALRETEMPFAPSIVVATLIVTLWEEQLIDIYYWLFL